MRVPIIEISISNLRRIVLIADEAHHLSSATKNKGELFGSWEGTVLEVLNQNIENVLLEFTATLAYESKEISLKVKYFRLGN